MKGILFTEFLEMVDHRYSVVMTERIIEDAVPASGAVYTAVGDYDHRELQAMIKALGVRADEPEGDICRAFGRHLFEALRHNYPQYFGDADDCFDFLEYFSGRGRKQVAAVYPGVEMPEIAVERQDDATMLVDYRSERGFADLAEGVIDAIIEHFGGHVALHRLDAGDDGRHARFCLQHQLLI